MLLDPSAAEFGRHRRKIWSRQKSAEKKFDQPKIRRKVRQPAAIGKKIRLRGLYAVHVCGHVSDGFFSL